MSPLLLFLGQIVIMVQPKLPGSGYQVLGVGQVVRLPENGSVPQDVVPVIIAALEEIPACDQLKVGQVVLWPKIHLAIPGSRSNPPPTQEESSEEAPSSHSESATPPKEDRLMNYALQCLQLGVMLMQLNDTEKEGDGERSIINWKPLMLYFRSRKRGMKYAFEAMRLITSVRALYTEKTAHRIIHGQFVNVRGGPGNNYANDLRMEMMVKDDKEILKGMCGNKTLKAVERSTSAACGLKKIVEVIDRESGVPPDSTQHTHTCTQETVTEIIEILKETRPFQHQAGRKSFPNISKSPLDQLDVASLSEWLTRHKRRLARNAFESFDDDDDDDGGGGGQNNDDENEQVESDTDEDEVEVSII